MDVKAGTPCCFCGEKLVFDGERVFCASRDPDGSACVGRLRVQEEPIPQNDLDFYEYIGAAILADLIDRRGLKFSLLDMRDGSPFIYNRMKWQVGKIAFDAYKRYLGKGEQS